MVPNRATQHQRHMHLGNLDIILWIQFENQISFTNLHSLCCIILKNNIFDKYVLWTSIWEGISHDCLVGTDRMGERIYCRIRSIQCLHSGPWNGSNRLEYYTVTQYSTVQTQWKYNTVVSHNERSCPTSQRKLTVFRMISVCTSRILWGTSITIGNLYVF